MYNIISFQELVDNLIDKSTPITINQTINSITDNTDNQTITNQTINSITDNTDIHTITNQTINSITNLTTNFPINSLTNNNLSWFEKFKIITSINIENEFETLYSFYKNNSKLGIKKNQFIWIFENKEYNNIFFLKLLSDFCNVNIIFQEPIRLKNEKYQNQFPYVIISSEWMIENQLYNFQSLPQNFQKTIKILDLDIKTNKKIIDKIVELNPSILRSELQKKKKKDLLSILENLI